ASETRTSKRAHTTSHGVAWERTAAAYRVGSISPSFESEVSRASSASPWSTEGAAPRCSPAEITAHRASLVSPKHSNCALKNELQRADARRDVGFARAALLRPHCRRAAEATLRAYH